MTAMLPKGEPEPHVLFVSVDPRRDTPEALALYATSNGFPKNLTAATGTDAELQALAKDLKAAYSVEEDPSSASGYLVNHTALIYLMDANWKLRTYFFSEMPPAAMARCVAAIS
jgi:protein SCO1/2